MSIRWRKVVERGWPCWELRSPRNTTMGRVHRTPDLGWHWAAFHPDHGGGSLAWGHQPSKKQAMEKAVRALHAAKAWA